MARLEVEIDGRINGAEKSVNRAISLVDRFGNEVSKVSAKAEVSNARTAKSFNNLGSSVGRVTRPARGASTAMVEFSRIFQDLPYGVRGVTNNIQQLAFTMGAGGGLLLGISLATAALDYFYGSSKKTKEEVDALGNEITEFTDKLKPFERGLLQGGIEADKSTSKLRILWKVINDASTSVENRTAAIKELQKIFPDYFGKLTQEQILTQKGADAYANLTKNIIAASNARAAQKELDTATESVRGNEKFIESQEKLLIPLDERIAKLRRINSIDKENAALAGEGFAGIGVEKELEKLLKERLGIETKILDTKLRNIQLTGEQSKLEKEILSGISEGGVSSFLEDFGDEIKKGAEGARDTIKDISTDALKITSPLAEGLSKAAKSFEKDLVNAYSNAAKTLPNADFAAVLKGANAGPSGIRVAPDLSGPKGEMAAVISGTATEWDRQMSRAVTHMTRNFYTSLERIASQGDLTFGTLFSGIVQSATGSFNRLFLGSFASKLEDVFSGATKKLELGLNDAIGAVGLVGGLLSSTGTAGGTIAGGALSGAAAGASIGSIVPGIGTAVGAVAGGVIGLLGGIFGSNKKREQIQQQQLEQLKKAVAYTSQVIGKYVAGVGVVENVSLNTFGELTATVKGKDLQFVMAQQNRATGRGI